MRSWKWLLSYVTMASLGLGFALVLSLKFVKAARSQTPSAQAPPSGELPPEFLSETGGSTPAAPAAATPPTTAATPQPAGTSAPPSPTPGEASSGAGGAGNSPDSSVGAPAANVSAGASEPETLTAPAPIPRMGGEDYTYDPTGRRDPFKPYRSFQQSTPQRPSTTANNGNNGGNSENVPVEPLQRWDVERLKVIGILWEVRAPKAMLRDPDGAIYTVTKNTKVGRYNGYVAAIREGEVVVVETLEVEGQPRKETKILELGK